MSTNTSTNRSSNGNNGPVVVNENGQAAQAKAKNRPLHVVRYGAIKAVIWRNETSAGPICNITVARSYRDGEQWKETGTFGFDDLLTLAKCLDLAHSWIHDMRDRESQTPPAE
jgi:hypothetical protein